MLHLTSDPDVYGVLNVSEPISGRADVLASVLKSRFWDLNQLVEVLDSGGWPHL